MGAATHLFETAWEYQGYRIINCQTCGFAHLDPLPAEFNLDEFYHEQYFREIKPFPYDAVNAEFVKVKRDRALQNQNYLHIYQQVTAYCAAASKTILDIGCGNDLLTVFFTAHGWEPVIIEPSKDAAEYLGKYGLKVYNQPVETIDELGLKTVAFVNLQFVLEHILEPFTVLKKLHQLMAPGAIIRICVPNDFSEGQLAYLEYYRENPHWVYLPDHVNYFSFNSLSQLLAKTGFREVYRTTNFPLEFLLLGGLNYYASSEERAKVGTFVNNFQSAFLKTGRSQVLDRLYENLARQGLGRSIFMLAVKE